MIEIDTSLFLKINISNFYLKKYIIIDDAK